MNQTATEIEWTTAYIARIRNHGKRDYAHAYLAWYRHDRLNADAEPKSCNFGIGFLAAQAVRMNLAELNQKVG